MAIVKRAKPIVNKLSLESDVIIVIIRHKQTIENIGSILLRCLEYLLSNLLAARPAKMGIIIIFTMPSIIATKSMCVYWLAKIFITKGVIIGEAKVEHAVIVTERATLPRARYVMTFDATPPGKSLLIQFLLKSLGQARKI